VNLCTAFPTLFDLIDESKTLEVDGVASKTRLTMARSDGLRVGLSSERGKNMVRKILALPRAWWT
jgi:hypothetical protein